MNDIIEIISGGTPKTSVKEYWIDGEIGWLSISDFNNDNRFVYKSEKTITELALKESNTKLLKKEDIIISARGTVGVLAQIGTPMAFNQSCFGIRGKKGIADNTYLYYSLKNYVANIQKRGQGSVFNTINLDSFKLMNINVEEDINTQQKIASVLSALDDKIELNNKINAELEAMAKTLYDYWFVQFDFPNPSSSSGQAGKPYKSSGGEMVYNEVLKREIPKGWEVGDLSNLGDVIGGSTPPRENEEYFSKSGTAWITPRDLSNNKGNKFIVKGELDVSEMGIKNASLRVMPKGSVLLSTRAPVGYLAISQDEVTTNQGFKSFVPNKGFSTEFIYYAIKNLIPTIENNAVGSTFKEISASTLKSIPICFPEITVLEAYNKFIISFFDRQKILELQNQELASLRDWLLPMLMNGQVKVVEGYQYIEEKLGMVAEEGLGYKTKNNEL
ncbi:MAG: restriction endonuclease subunit S [Sphingobacteriaceae bacterium]